MLLPSLRCGRAARTMSRRDELRSAVAFAVLGAVMLIASWRMDRLVDRGIDPWSVPGLTPGVVAKRRFCCSRVTIFRKAFAKSTLTSGSSSCFRTCPHLPGDALIEFDSRRELGGWIPLRIVLCLFHRRCRLPQWRPARRGDSWWPGGFADVIQILPHGAGVVDDAMIRTPRVLPRCSYAAPSGRIGLWQIGQLSGRAS